MKRLINNGYDFILCNHRKLDIDAKYNGYMCSILIKVNNRIIVVGNIRNRIGALGLGNIKVLKRHCLKLW